MLSVKPNAAPPAALPNDPSSSDAADGGARVSASGDGGPAETPQTATTGRVDWTFRPSEVVDSQQDPLLACLIALTKHFERPMSGDALTSGLPVVDGALTPELFGRAAARAGLTARLTRRPLTKISKLVLPAVLLLRDRRACILTRWTSRDEALIITPESGEGSSRVALRDLAEEYAGYALFVRPEYRFDGRVDDTNRPRPKHWFWGTIGRLWPAYVEVIAAAGIVNLLALASPLFIMNVYDRVLPNQAFATLWVLAIGIGVALAFDFLLRSLRNVLIDTVGRRADVLLASQIFEHVLNIKLAARPASTGAFANHLREFETVRDFFTSSTLASFTDLMFVGLFIFVIAMIAGPLAWIPAIAVMLALTVGLLVQIPLSRTVRQSQEEAAQKHGILVETVSSLDTIKSLSAEGRMQRAWEGFVGATSRTTQSTRFFSNLAINLTTLIQQSVTVFIVIGGVYLVSAGDMTMGAIIAAVILGGRAVGPLAGLAGTLSRMHQSFTALGTLNRLMETPVERPQGRHVISRPITEGSFEFRDVTFGYPGSSIPALRDLSLSVAAGERVGVIGRIGSGKTTLSRLLVGFYEPDQGAVTIDGVDIRQYHPTDIRRGVGMVMQDVTLFYGTVRDNISLGAPHADDAMVLRAAQLAGVDEWVGNHPMGYNLPVGERGQYLSGGQRQSIALARALLMDPPVLLLDEPTSAMDNLSEQAFVRRLRTVLDGKRTLLVTTHRASLLRVVDRLVVLEQGAILADGPRDQVLKSLKDGQIAGARRHGAGAG